MTADTSLVMKNSKRLVKRLQESHISIDKLVN